MKIRTRLLLFNLALLVVSAGILVLTFFIFGERYLHHVAITDITRSSRQTLMAIDRLFESRMAEQRTLSRSTFFFRDLNTQKSLEQIQSRFEDYRQFYHSYQSISFYDVHRVRKIDLNRLNLGQKTNLNSFFDQALKAEGPIYQFDVTSPTRPVVHFLTRVQRSGEKLRGYVLATVPLANLKRTLIALSTSGDNPSAVQLFSRDGSRIYSRHATLNDADSDIDLELKSGDHKVIPTTLPAGGRLFESEKYYTVLFERTNDVEPTNSWKLAYQVKKSDVERPIIALRKMIFAIVVILFLVAIALNSWVSQSLLVPIEKLTASMLNYNLGARVADTHSERDLRRPDEIGVLTRGVRDLTERLKTNFAELSTTSKFIALGEMAAGIAHEINNPLTVIMGRAAILERTSGSVNAKEVRESSHKIIEMVHRITRTIHSLRVYARSGEADAVGVESVESIVESTLDICLERLRLASIQIQVKIDPPDAVVIARPVQISQILMNLLNNAHDAIVSTNPEDRWIHLHVTETDHSVVIRVQNSGPRISKDVEHRLFEPFFTTKPSGEGTGLGLTISQRLAEANGAKLSIDESDESTTFLLEFPRPDITLLQHYRSDAEPS